MRITLLAILVAFGSTPVIAQQDTTSTPENPLPNFIGTWEADYIRTIDGEERTFRIYYQGVPTITGDGVRVAFYSALEDGVLGEPWMDATYFYSDVDNKVHVLGSLSSNSVGTAIATIEEDGSLQLIFRDIGKDDGDFNLNTWKFPSNDEIVFESTRYVNYNRIDFHAIARARRVSEQ